MLTYQVIPNEGTSAGPCWCNHEGRTIWSAWKGQGSDIGIYVAEAPIPPVPLSTSQADGSQHVLMPFGPQHNVAGISTSVSPAITSLDGVLYLF